VSEVVSGGEGGGEPEAQPSDDFVGMEEVAFYYDGGR